MAIILNGANNSTPQSPKQEDLSGNTEELVRIFVDESIEKTIILDELSSDFVGQDSGGEEKKISNKNIAGTEFPVIKIGDFLTTVEDIKRMTIDLSGRIPSISLILSMKTTQFRSTSMPKDGDIISVFMAPKSETLSSIRCDFLLKSINPIATPTGLNATVSGDLFIPGFESTNTFGTVGTSKEAFIDAAKKFGLGFATDDEDNTNDKQLWVCGNDSCLHYLENVSQHAWKDEMSFYDWWIDAHYNINFINVNKILLQNKFTFDITANTISAMGDYDVPVDNSQDNTKPTNKVFTNDPKYSSGVFYVRKWDVINNSSSISTETGVEIQSNEFLHNSEIYKSGESPKLTLSNVPAYDPDKLGHQILLRGRAEYDESTNPKGEQARANYNFKELYVYNDWSGISYVMNDSDSETDDTRLWNGNVNKNYTRSKFHNEINLAELDKMTVEIEVNGLCTQVMRGEVVPLALKKDNTLEMTTPNKGAGGRGERFYNGWYYVQGVKYEYVKGNPSQYVSKFTLTRREWPLPVDYVEPADGINAK